MTNQTVENTRAELGEVVMADLAGVALSGPSGVLWGLDSPQLNVNFVTLKAGDAMQEHVNEEVDVLIIVISGSGQILIDGNSVDVTPDSVTLIPRATSRSIHSSAGMVFYSIHARRLGPTITARS